ncbi:MAG: hypothetical protein PHG91_11875 [Syntrophales bacterium]|nr:hypothetical protein [Syntrophales bacterium]MDD5532312.1 hypothetical protein [Syntrophales bacterium]
MGGKRAGQGKHLHLLIAALTLLIAVGGCSSLRIKDSKEKYSIWEARRLYAKGDMRGAMKEYRGALKTEPGYADECLFHIGAIYASAKYPERDFHKSLDAFQRVVREHPRSSYRPESERASGLVREILSRERKLKDLRKKNSLLEKKIEQIKDVDLDVVEKRKKLLQEQ